MKIRLLKKYMKQMRENQFIEDKTEKEEEKKTKEKNKINPKEEKEEKIRFRK